MYTLTTEITFTSAETYLPNQADNFLSSGWLLIVNVVFQKIFDQIEISRGIWFSTSSGLNDQSECRNSNFVLPMMQAMLQQAVTDECFPFIFRACSTA